MNMNRQRGVSLSALMMWGVVLVVVTMLGMKVVPSAIEYYKLKKDIHATVEQSNQNSSVADVRRAFSKFAEIDHLAFKPEDLDITKENGQIVISFEYEKKIPLFANVSLVIDYAATTGAAQE
ncbi:MAG TPA: DUF4845 domain-containing protein [Rhodocyclaceae bacterium]|nr:DUF4845 domain-containing protein [Rhodocyclaceae bacterium]